MVVLGSSPNGALHRSVDPEAAGWSPDSYLLAAAVDYLALSIWQRGGGKNAKPQPVWRPHTKSKRKGRSLTADAIRKSGGSGGE